MYIYIYICIYIYYIYIYYIYNQFIEFLHLHSHMLLFHLCSKLHPLPSNVHLYLWERCFTNNFDSILIFIVSNTLKFVFFVLFGRHNILNGS